LKRCGDNVETNMNKTEQVMEYYRKRKVIRKLFVDLHRVIDEIELERD